MTDVVVEYGVRLPSGRIEPVHYDADTATVMSHEEYANRRAEALGGVVVTRTAEVVKSEWESKLTPAEAIVERLRVEVAHIRALEGDIEYVAAQHLADLVEEYLEVQQK